VKGFTKDSNEPLCSMKGGELLDYLTDYELLMKESAPQSC
jgi:hypothetical protein